MFWSLCMKFPDDYRNVPRLKRWRTGIWYYGRLYKLWITGERHWTLYPTWPILEPTVQLFNESSKWSLWRRRHWIMYRVWDTFPWLGGGKDS
jgi:hypothetical protein